MLCSLNGVCCRRSRGNQYIWRCRKLILSSAASVQKLLFLTELSIYHSPWKICLSSQGKITVQENNLAQFGWGRSEVRASASPLAANLTAIQVVMRPGAWSLPCWISFSLCFLTIYLWQTLCWVLAAVHQSFLVQFLPAVTVPHTSIIFHLIGRSCQLFNTYHDMSNPTPGLYLLWKLRMASSLFYGYNCEIGDC